MESVISDQVRFETACDASASGTEAASVRIITADGPIQLCHHHAEVNRRWLERYPTETIGEPALAGAPAV